MPEGSEYVFDNRAIQAGDRFRALSSLFDPVTFRHLDAVGIGPNWRCWEVGAGGPDVANWMADRSGAGGYVLASDINTSWVDERVHPTVEVRQHDVVTDAPPDGGFDVIHARLVLSHLPARATVLERIVSALRPGGWVLIEDLDQVMPLSCVDPYLAEHRRANEVHTAVCDLLGRRGVDLTFARSLPRLFRDAGLRRVGADAYFAVAAPAANVLRIANVTQLRDALVANGLATPGDIDAHVRALTDGTVEVGTMPLISAWGQRP